MTIKKNDQNVLDFKSLEEEREYWENRGPLAKGARSKLIKPISPKRLESFLSIRLSGKELTELRELSMKCGRGPSTFAREILLIVLDYINSPKSDSGKKQIPVEDVCKALAAKMPEAFKDKIADLMKSSIIGDVKEPSLIVFDRSQMKELAEIGVKMFALLAESTNPNIKIVTPFDQRYEKVKSLLEMKEDNNALSSRPGKS